MADPEPQEEIVYKLDGVKVPLESLPPDARADVARRLKEARALYTSKYPQGKLRLNINVKVKTSTAARKAAGSNGAAAAVVIIDDGGKPWPIIIVVALALFGGLYLFVPAITKAVDAGLAAVHRKK